MIYTYTKNLSQINYKKPKYARFLRSKFPRIIVTLTGEQETPDNFQEYLDELYANYDRREPFVLLFDASRAGRPNMHYQRKQAQWMKENKKLIQTYCLGVGYVVPNNMLRQLLKTIFTIQKNPVPFRVFKSLENANEWADDVISKCC